MRLSHIWHFAAFFAYISKVRISHIFSAYFGIFGGIKYSDSERSNSIYKLINSNRRRCMTKSSLRMHVFLYFNKNKPDAFAVDDDMDDDELGY